MARRCATPPRDVEVYRAELLGHDGESARYEIECSTGTYVRTLIETLGDAYCAELRRTAIGPFRVRGRRPGDLGRARRRADPRGSGGDEVVANIQVTQLPDVEPRPRHVAIGTFDGVHRGHQAVIEGADTVLTFDPHPLEVIHPAALPKLIMPFGVKRDVIEGLGVQELVVDPLRPRVRQSLRGGLHRACPDRDVGREAGLGRRELPLRRQGQG